MTSQKLVVMSGLPASGKSTVAEGLSRHFSIPVSRSIRSKPDEARRHPGTRRHRGLEEPIGHADEQLRLDIRHVEPSTVEAPRAAWRELAARHRAQLKIIECVCADETIHRRRVEARRRNIEGMPELRWERVLERRAEYEPWRDVRLVLDTSTQPPTDCWRKRSDRT